MVYNEVMTSDQRRYRKRKRARQEEETRRRITEAVVELHRTVGPARTKVTEVAERAGVSRMTVYNHFPTEAELIEACSSHWAAQNPFPDPAAWAAVGDPGQRLRAALTDLYAWYADTEDMMGNVLRDAPIVEPLADIMDERWRPWLARVVELLAEGWRRADPGQPAASVEDAEPVAPEEAELVAALRVAVDFRTWRLLTSSTGDAEAAVDVAVRMVGGAARLAGGAAGAAPLSRT